MPVATANQTIGPYWHLIEDPSWSDLTRFGARRRTDRADRIDLSMAAGKPVVDAAVEIWQTSPERV